MQYWQGSDAFARVSMSVGTSLFAIALSYYVLGYVLVYNHAIVGAWLAVILFWACAWALLRIDMSLTGYEYIFATLLQIGGPFAMAVCTTLWELDSAPTAIKVLLPLIFFSHAAWLLYLTQLCKVVEQRNGAMVPTGFKAVLYIDVFGWIKRSVSTKSSLSKFADIGNIFEEENAVHGKGPAMQTIRYENGKPVPVRPEFCLDASREPEPSQTTREDLSPSTFVPPHEDSTGEDRHWAPGTFGGKPWKVFSMLKLQFACIWVLSGIIVGVGMCRRSAEIARPLPSHYASMLQFEHEPSSSLIGEFVATEWPHENVQPHALSCDDSRQLIIASSRHKVYASDLAGRYATDRITFSRSPICEEVEGGFYTRRVAPMQPRTLKVFVSSARAAPKGATSNILLHQVELHSSRRFVENWWNLVTRSRFKAGSSQRENSSFRNAS